MGMADIGTAYIVMAYIVRAYTVTASIGMAYTVMAYVHMAYPVLAYIAMVCTVIEYMVKVKSRVDMCTLSEWQRGRRIRRSMSCSRRWTTMVCRVLLQVP